MKQYIRKHFDLSLVFSGYHDNDWLYEEIQFPWFKPAAFLTIDDRAMTFDGYWPTIGELQNFQSWIQRNAREN